MITLSVITITGGYHYQWITLTWW